MPFEQCHYPGCKLKGVTTFALVPLCDRHKKLIVEETKNYYANNTFLYIDRKHFLEIAELIPWSRFNEELG